MPSTGTTHLDFVADHLDYESKTSEIHLRGRVKIVESTYTIKGSEVWLDTKRRLGRSQGDLLVEDGATAVYGDSGEFDFEKHVGNLYHASAGHGDWRVHAKSAHAQGRLRLDYYGADFTSCDNVPAHYHFHASHLKVVPRKYLLATNTLFYLGPLPILYTPFFYKSLNPKPFLRLKILPGYDRRNGVFAKGTLLTDWSPYVYSKLYLDYYSAQGVGTGLELERRKGQDSRGALYGYHIRETSSGTERWALLGTAYHSPISSVAVQGRLQVQSDAAFNNDYSRASLFRVTPQLINNAAVSYRLPQVTYRLSYARVDNAAPGGIKYLRAVESAPRFDAFTAPLKFGKLPWLNTLTGFAENNYDQTRPFVQKSAGGGWEGTRTIPLVRGAAFIPKAGYTETFYDRIDFPADFLSSATARDAFVGRYSGQGTLRFATPLGDWDVSQLYQRRFKADTFEDDAGGIDHGVETNLFTLEDAFRPTRKVLLRALSGYDFRVFRDRTVGFRERVQPIVGEAVYTPRPSLSFTARDDYQLEQGNRSFLFSGQVGDELGAFFGAGAGYNLAQSDQYFLNTEFGYSPSTDSWRLTGALRSQAVTPGGIGRLGRYGLFEKEFTLAKVWHDFFTRVMVRFRPGGVREAFIRIDLKLGRTAKDQPPRRDWEAEWFPERKSALTERP